MVGEYVDMHMFANCDQNVPYGSRVMTVTDGRTHIVIIVHTQGSCNLLTKIHNEDKLDKLHVSSLCRRV